MCAPNCQNDKINGSRFIEYQEYSLVSDKDESKYQVSQTVVS